MLTPILLDPQGLIYQQQILQIQPSTFSKSRIYQLDQFDYQSCLYINKQKSDQFEISQNITGGPNELIAFLIEDSDQDNIKKQKLEFFKNTKKINLEMILDSKKQESIANRSLKVDSHKYNQIYNIPLKEFQKLSFAQKIYKLEQISQKLFQKMSIAIGQVDLISEQHQSSNVFQCQHCGKCFNKACALGGHVARVHKESGLQLYYMKNEKRSKKQISFSRNLFQKQRKRIKKLITNKKVWFQQEQKKLNMEEEKDKDKLGIQSK